MKHIYTLLLAAFAFSGNAQLKINEILATNNSSSAVVDTNEFGKREDWFEIYNMGSIPVDLAGYKVSDDQNNFRTIPSGFAFTVIPARGFVRIWADDTTTKTGMTQIHVNFKLGASGDKVILRSPNDVTLDSVAFGQQTANVSIGRCPDGTGDFEPFTTPTPAAANCPAQVSVKEINEHSFMVYPNPVSNFFVVEGSEAVEVKLISMNGAFINFGKNETGKQFDVAALPAGIYFVELRSEKSVVYKRLVKQ